MRVALFTDGIYPYVIGGMQKHSFYLAKYLAMHQIEVDLYHTAKDLSILQTLDCFTAEEKKYIHSYPIAFPKLDSLPGHYIRESYAYSTAIFEKAITNSPVDFIYVQGLTGMKLLENKNKLKAIVGINFHGLEMFQKTANVKSKLEQYLFKRPVIKAMKHSDLVFSLGGKITEIIKAQGIEQTKISQIAIGIDESWLRTATVTATKMRTFVFVGRYERRKGIEELTIAIQQLLPLQNAYFEFIGDIPEAKKIKSNVVTYHGSITDVQQIKNILLAADVLICPSYSEGMPTVILEAMASGLAIIACNVGAVSEQVDVSNGRLIIPGDITALKKEISFFIQQPNDALIKMKKQSIHKIKETFLWKKIIFKTIEEMERVVGK
jgi:glycosyltransferase involved in cell wall biosynthesis